MCGDPDVVVCPADGRLEDIGDVSLGGIITVKGRGYGVAELVGDVREERRYARGAYAVIYLSPGDYHRVHAPTAGGISWVRSLPGDFFPVNAVGQRYIPSLLVRNRRVAIAIETERFGRVTVVMVGALIVGRITVSTLAARDVPFGAHQIEPARRVERGDEIGVFHLGSTVVVLVEKRASEAKASVAAYGAGSRVRVGESLVFGGP
jgi:phosphatidylserine decarboxylase